MQKAKKNDPNEPEVLDKVQLQQTIDDLKAKNISKHTVLTMSEPVFNKLGSTNRFYLTAPFLLGIPLFWEFFLDFTHPKADALYALLYTADTLFFVKTYMAFRLRKGAVLAIHFLVDKHKFEFEHFPWFGWRDSTLKSLVDPAHIIKVKGAAFNPFVGYRNKETNTNYATEGTGTWHDRQLFDSVIEVARQEQKEETDRKRIEQKKKRQQRLNRKEKKGNPFD